MGILPTLNPGQNIATLANLANLATLVTLATLAACGDPEYRPMDEAMPVEDSAFGGQFRTLEKAARVEDELERAAREREEQIRRQGG